MDDFETGQRMAGGKMQTIQNLARFYPVKAGILMAQLFGSATYVSPYTAGPDKIKNMALAGKSTAHLNLRERVTSETVRAVLVHAVIEPRLRQNGYIGQPPEDILKGWNCYGIWNEVHEYTFTGESK